MCEMSDGINSGEKKKLEEIVIVANYTNVERMWAKFAAVSKFEERF